MRIIYPIHAKERMERRNITKEQVEQSLREPEVKLPTQHKRRRRIMKRFGSKTLDVIYEPRGKDKVILVTAVWLEEEDREVKEAR